jgi:hypothetical protein
MKEMKLPDGRTIKTDRLDHEMRVTPIVTPDGQYKGYVRGDGMVALFAEGGTIDCAECGQPLVQRKHVLLPDPSPDLYCGKCWQAQRLRCTCGSGLGQNGECPNCESLLGDEEYVPEGGWHRYAGPQVNEP